MIEEMKRQNLQMLGFFTAIISFTVGSIQIVKSQPFISAVLLLLVLAGILLVIYAGFSYVMFSNSTYENARKNFVVFGVGAIIIVLSIVAYQQGWLGEVVSFESIEGVQKGT